MEGWKDGRKERRKKWKRGKKAVGIDGNRE